MYYTYTLSENGSKYKQYFTDKDNSKDNKSKAFSEKSWKYINGTVFLFIYKIIWSSDSIMKFKKKVYVGLSVDIILCLE